MTRLDMVLRIFIYFYTPEGVVTGVKKLAANAVFSRPLQKQSVLMGVVNPFDFF